MVDETLIFDIGMSEGNDTAYYLAKGFRVVGVEADPVVYEALLTRFAAEISDGRLTLIHGAAADESGKTIQFLHNDIQQGISGTSKHPHVQDGYSEFDVKTISWKDIVSEQGIPYYCKVDIEGQERNFLKHMIGSVQLPTFFSVECHDLDPVAILFASGYRRFKLIDQVPPGGFVNVHPPREGAYVENPNWHHSSGPFGKELPGEWMDFEQFVITHRVAQAYRSRGTWYDCHATKS